MNPTYKKENGLWLLNTDSPDLPMDFSIHERNIVYIPAGEFGGNHRHPRQEAFIGIGSNLELIWQDQDGQRHVETMSPEGKGDLLALFVVRSMTPHAVVNRGQDAAVLIEFADSPQHDLEPVNLL